MEIRGAEEPRWESGALLAQDKNAQKRNVKMSTIFQREDVFLIPHGNKLSYTRFGKVLVSFAVFVHKPATCVVLVVV